MSRLAAGRAALGEAEIGGLDKHFSMSDDDAELVALIHNELEESSGTLLQARLAGDDQLCQRYEELRQTSTPLTASLDVLLEQPPAARLCATLLADRPRCQSSRRLRGIALQELGAGVASGFSRPAQRQGSH